MTRKGILLTLAAVAVGLLVLGTIGTPEARAGRIYLVGITEVPPYTATAFVQEENWLGPQYQRVSYPYDYDFTGLDAGMYDVWGEYEDATRICSSEIYEVDLSQDEQHKQDIYIYAADCEYKP